jgi:tetratricopeptide (TPR) repeat protein
MEERAYPEALETFRAFALHDHTLVPIVWKGRALKRIRRLPEAIEVLSVGLRQCDAADEKFRRAVVLWNLACYRALMNRDRVDSVIELLTEALHNAPEFREDPATENLDRDLVPLLGNPVFERWRGDVLNKER